MFHRLGDLGLTTLLGAQIPLGTHSLQLGNNLINSLEHIPLSVTYLDLGCNRITSLEHIPLSVTDLDLGRNRITSLEHIPLSVTSLKLGRNLITSLEHIPLSVTDLHLGQSPLHSLRHIPQNLMRLYLGTTPITSLEHLPQGLKYLNLGESYFLHRLEHLPQRLIHLCLHWCEIDNIHEVILPRSLTHLYLGRPVLNDVAFLLRAAQVGCLQEVFNKEASKITKEALKELRVLLKVPLKVRPRRLVQRVAIVVLSSSSIPRVGTRAAVRRLHRAFLVREMAGMMV